MTDELEAEGDSSSVHTTPEPVWPRQRISNGSYKSCDITFTRDYDYNRHKDAGGANLSQPDEMAKQDPLSIQLWKFYARTKTQIPNHERLEFLTWRMAAINLKRKETE